GRQRGVGSIDGRVARHHADAAPCERAGCADEVVEWRRDHYCLGSLALQIVDRERDAARDRHRREDVLDDAAAPLLWKELSRVAEQARVAVVAKIDAARREPARQLRRVTTPLLARVALDEQLIQPLAHE